MERKKQLLVIKSQEKHSRQMERKIVKNNKANFVPGTRLGCDCGCECGCDVSAVAALSHSSSPTEVTAHAWATTWRPTPQTAPSQSDYNTHAGKAKLNVNRVN